MRSLYVCLILLIGNTGIASAAAISAVLKPGYPGDLTGLISRTSEGVQSDHYDGPITPWNPPSFQTVVFVNYNVDGGVALVRTDVSRQDNSGSTRIALTTYSNMYFENSVSTGNATYLVNNNAYWEFVIDGNYDWEIRDTDPLIRSSFNRRTYEFVKVQGGGGVYYFRKFDRNRFAEPQGFVANWLRSLSPTFPPLRFSNLQSHYRRG